MQDQATTQNGHAATARTPQANGTPAVPRQGPRSDDAAIVPFPQGRARGAAGDGGPYAQTRAGRYYEIPNPFDVRDDGVWLVKYDKDAKTGLLVEKSRVRIATAPVLPTQILYAPDGEELLEITWWHAKYGRPVSEVVPRSIASVGRALVKTLHPKGFPVTDTDGPKVEKYLAEVEAENAGRLGTDTIARQLGWQPDGVFVAGQGRPRRVDPSYLKEQRGALAAHHVRGTLEGWQDAARHAADYSTPRATVAASLAAPMLELVEGVPPFAFDIHSTSSGGKTTSAQLGYSAWGNPQLGAGGGIAQWSATRTAIQLRLSLCNGLPVVLDESKNVRSEDIVKQVIYDLPNGEAGARAGEYFSAPIAWSTVVISTGERSLLAFTADAGAAARVLSPGDGAPFGRHGERSAAAALAVAEGVAQHYGHVGPAFVGELLAGDKREWIVERHAELTAVHRTGSDITRRRAPLVALLQVAEEVGCWAGLLPYEPMSTERWAELLGGNQATDNPGERALEVVRSFVARNPHRMYSEKTSEISPAGGWIGARREFDGRDVVALYPEPLKEEMTRQGFEIDAVKPFWIEKGWLTLDPKQPSWLIRRRLTKGGARVRVFEVTADVFDGEGDD